MRRWTYAINSIYKISHIHCEEAPWWVFAIDSLVCKICDLIPPIPLPNIKKHLSDKDDIEFAGGEWTTWREWYGDISQLFCGCIHIPITNWCWGRANSTILKVNYNDLKDAFRERDIDFWEHEEEIAIYAGEDDGE